MKDMKSRLEELTSNNKKLQEQEQLLRAKYDQVCLENLHSRTAVSNLHTVFSVVM